MRRVVDELAWMAVAGFGAALLFALSSAVNPPSATVPGYASSLALAAAGGAAAVAVLALAARALDGVLTRNPRSARALALAAAVVGAALWLGCARLLGGRATWAVTDLFALPWLVSASCFGLTWRGWAGGGRVRRLEGLLLAVLGSALLLGPAVLMLDFFGVWRARAVLGVLLVMTAALWLAQVRASPPPGGARLPGAELATLSVLALAGGLSAATLSGEQVPLRSVFLTLAGGVIAAALGARVIAPGVYWSSAARRAGTLALAALGVVAMHRAVAAPWSGPAGELPSIEVSKQTTRVTEPLREDGTPDYAEWLNRRHGAGVTPENNAAVLLAPVLGVELTAEARARLGIPEPGADQPWLVGGPYDHEGIREALGAVEHPLAATPDFEDAFYDQYIAARSSPWQAGEHPLLDAWLELSGPALARIEVASLRPRFWLFVTPRDLTPSSPLPSLLGFRAAAEALQLRAMRSLGAGRWDLAARDVLAAHRLGSLVSQDSPLVARLIGVAIRGIAGAVVPQLAARIDAGRRPEAQRLRLGLSERLDLPGIAESLDGYERIVQLAVALHLRRLAISRGPGAWADELEPREILASLGAHPSLAMTSVYTMDPRSIDWNRALRLLNRAWDAQVEMASADPARREQARRAWEDRYAWLEDPPLSALVQFEPSDVRRWAIARLSLDPTRLFVASIGGGLPVRAGVSWNEAQALYRLGLWSLELGIERAEAGSFPRERTLTPELDGYRFRYIAGPAARAEPARSQRFAITAVPVQRDQTGVRDFCVDGEGAARYSIDGTVPVEEARCEGGEPVR